MMLETDYVFAKVPDLPSQVGSDGGVMPVAFPFHYIQPAAQHLKPIIREMYTEDLGPVTDIQPSGPAPVLIKVEQLTQVQAFAQTASNPLWRLFLRYLFILPFSLYSLLTYGDFRYDIEHLTPVKPFLQLAMDLKCPLIDSCFYSYVLPSSVPDALSSQGVAAPIAHQGHD